MAHLQLFRNKAATVLAASIAGADTTINVVSGAGFPDAAAMTGGHYFYAVLCDQNETAWEVVKVTGVSGTAWTVVRGIDGSGTNLSWPVGSRVEMRLVAQALQDIAAALP